MKTKKYKLLKDLPYAKAGKVFEVPEGEISVVITSAIDHNGYYLDPTDLSEWFEEVDGRWKPEIDDGKYWALDSEMDVEFCYWGAEEMHSKSYNAGNCFRTEKQAKSAAKKVKKILLSLHE